MPVTRPAKTSTGTLRRSCAGSHSLCNKVNQDVARLWSTEFEEIHFLAETLTVLLLFEPSELGLKLGGPTPWSTAHVQSQNKLRLKRSNFVCRLATLFFAPFPSSPHLSPPPSLRYLPGKTLGELVQAFCFRDYYYALTHS